jgi:hypothetical protein
MEREVKNPFAYEQNLGSHDKTLILPPLFAHVAHSRLLQRLNIKMEVERGSTTLSHGGFALK